MNNEGGGRDTPFVIPHKIMSEKEASLLGVLQLAFVGDTVYDLFVRTSLLASSELPMKLMHRAAVERVNATAQYEALLKIMPSLTEAEQGIVRRARNAKQRPPKNANPAHYQSATGFEALLGFLYLSGQNERMTRLLDMTKA